MSDFRDLLLIGGGWREAADGTTFAGIEEYLKTTYVALRTAPID